MILSTTTRFIATATVAVLLLTGTPAVAGASADPAGLAADAAPRQGAAKPGRYTGTVLEDGKPSTKEWIRFRVSKNGRVLQNFRSRVWVICYDYPNTYTHLPVRFRAPNARIVKGKVNRRWQQRYTVDGERYRLRGHLRLNLRRPVVRGQISVDFSSCATKLGDPPHFVPLRASRR